MNKMKNIFLGMVILSQCLVAANEKPVAVNSKHKTRYEMACRAISEMVKQRSELRKELISLKSKLSQVLPSPDSDIFAQIEELAALREKLKKLSPEQAQQADLIKQMDSVIEKIKMHDHMVDLMTTILPNSVKLTENPSDKETALQQRIQLLVNRFTDSVKEAEKLGKQIDIKNSELTNIKKERDEVEHLLVELSRYATESAK